MQLNCSDNNIYPTGTCFDDALDTLVAILKADKTETAHRRLYLVHAICRMPDGHEFAHAWVEDIEQQKAIFSGILHGQRLDLTASIEEYRAHMNPIEITQYSYKQAYEHNRATGTYGPWIDRYRSLCRRKEDAREHRDPSHI